MTAPSIRLLIADDQRVVREGLSMLVGLIEGVEVVGTASDGIEAVELAQAEKPDVVLMDLRMPNMDGAEATRRIRAALPETQVLVLTTYADDESLFPALQAGARGYLTKDAERRGDRAGDPGSRGRAHAPRPGRPATPDRGRPRSPSPSLPRVRPLPDDLTPREAETLKLIAAGLSNAEIAKTLVVSDATVKTHINRVFRKTGVRDRAQAVRYAYEHGLSGG